MERLGTLSNSFKSWKLAIVNSRDFPILKMEKIASYILLCNKIDINRWVLGQTYIVIINLPYAYNTERDIY